MRPACPPLIFGCKFLNFSRSKSELDLAGRRAIREMEGQDGPPPPEYVNPASDKHRAMVERIRHRLGLTTLQYQQLDDLVKSIGLPREQLCTFCWDGREEPGALSAMDRNATHAFVQGQAFHPTHTV